MRVVVVGSGGVAEGLAHQLERCAPQSLVQVYGRNETRVNELSDRFGLAKSNLLQPADIYILAVSDDAVEALAAELPFAEGAIVVHTAGSVAMSALEGARGAKRGVLYPMQSFTVGRQLALGEVSLFVEGEDRATLERIKELANMLSHRVIEMTSEQRKQLHLAAVFASNFTNAMFSATSDLLRDAGLSFDLYAPLIEETVSKAMAASDPRRVQSGPAKRGDQRTMERHLALLEGREDLMEMYKSISKYIWETSKRI
ncbi:MAG: Rossmann-like and DUF2520 domain-containing protein [Rikenellaceae bacterium]